MPIHSLYKKLQLAARYNMCADDVIVIINEEPVVDTMHEKDKHTLMIADYELSEGMTITVAEIKRSQRVIYWKNDDKQYNATIAGLAWPAKDKSIFFSGKVLTP